MSEKLLPCPFCNAYMERMERNDEDEFVHPTSDYVECILDGLVWLSPDYDAAWNTRAPTSQWQPIESKGSHR